MTLVSFASAKGAPGVTQMLCGLARVWNRGVVLADLDPVGGDVWIRTRAADGELLDPDTGLLSLGAALRGGKAADLDDHLQEAQGAIRILSGIRTPAQGQGLGPAWPGIARLLSSASDDVLADCGRLAPGSAAATVAESSAALVFVTRSEVSTLVHLRERLHSMSDHLRLGAIDGVRVGVIIVGDPRDRRSAEDIERLMAASGLRVATLGTVAYEPKVIAALEHGVPRQMRRSDYMRSLTDVARAIDAFVDEGRRVPDAVQQGV